MRRAFALAASAVVSLAVAAACGGEKPAGTLLRLGHFPNVTHAHALIARALARDTGRDWFEERLGPAVSIEWYAYNAGPSAMEALLAETIDATYVGPSPALTLHIKSRGTEVRVLAGATRGGAALVVQGDGRIKGPEDFKGRRVATPQLGNTQDVACRAWLRAQGYELTATGGDVTVVPTSNPDQIALFKSGELDAAWTVEPWVSRLERDAGGKVLVEEKDAVTTVLVASSHFLKERAALAWKLADAHDELGRWIAAHPDEAQRLVADELAAQTKSSVSKELIARCWPRMRFDAHVTTADFADALRMAREVGYLRDEGDVSRLVPAR